MADCFQVNYPNSDYFSLIETAVQIVAVVVAAAIVAATIAAFVVVALASASERVVVGVVAVVSVDCSGFVLLLLLWCGGLQRGPWGCWGEGLSGGWGLDFG